MIKIRQNYLDLFFFVLSIWIIIFFPWQDIKNNAFNDISEYIRFLKNNDSINFPSFDLLFFLKEPLGELLILSSGMISKDPKFNLWILSIISITIFFISFYRIRANYLTYILIVSPLFIDLINSQIRNGFAISLFFLGYTMLGKKKYIFYFLSILIHLGHLPIIFFEIISRLKLIKGNNNLNKIYVLFFSVICMLIILSLGEYLLSISDDRRAGTMFSARDTTLLFIVWLLPSAAILMINLFKENKSASIEIFLIISIIYIFVVWYLGGYTSRNLAIIFPFLIYNMTKKEYKNIGNLLAIFSYNVYFFYIWI